MKIVITTGRECVSACLVDRKVIFMLQLVGCNIKMQVCKGCIPVLYD